jgi:O-acetylserine/cysteine efflux transporter
MLAAAFLGERFTKKKGGGVILASVGTILALNIKNPETGSVVGNLMVLCSAASYGVSGVVAKRCLTQGFHPLQLVGLQAVCGTGVLVLITVLSGDRLFVFSGDSWAAIAFLGVFPTFLSFVIWYVAMGHMEVSRLSFFIYLIPVFAGIFSYLLLKQPVTSLMVVSGVLIVVGVAVAQTHRTLKQ